VSRFRITDTPLAGLKIVERVRLEDERGFLSRLFCSEELGRAGWSGSVAQINHTMTRQQAAVRGLHYQLPPHAESKLVSCVKGEVWDVALDLRAKSPTFLSWHAEVLSAGNGRALLIPEGFAHGFQALAGETELLYLHSVAYAPASEAGIHPEDPRAAIAWPLAICELSLRDRSHPLLATDFRGIVL
jgi:dTDP-4-dehydrorhamnose 3,5-epimerase